MLILLPPSEGKSAPESGPVLDLTSLSFRRLTATRRVILTRLAALCRSDVSVAAATLGLGPTQRGEVGANARLRREPCGPAIEVYTGVLYEALDASTLDLRARRRLDDHVAIASALWGLVRPSDLIPSYRLSANVSLPGVGPLSHAWRAPLQRELAATDGLVVDLRSSAYVSLAPLPTGTAERSVTVRVLTEKAGRRTVVSHSNKATKGRVVRVLLDAGRMPKDVDALADVVAQAGFDVERGPRNRAGVDQLDVIVAGL